MSGLEIGIVSFFGLFGLLAMRMPIGTAMLIVGSVGIYLIRPPAALPVIGSEIFSEATSYALTILPMFILMGNLASISGMSRDLYDAAHSWVGHKPGGLASATIMGCAAFSALSGSSLAAAITMGRVSLPQMERYKYNDGFAAGAVAAGGTLGILIPPSAGFVIYAILTEVSIGQLFLAGVVPGLLLTFLFIVAIRLAVAVKSELAPQTGIAQNFGLRIRKTAKASTILSIIVISIGGIYLGVFSAVEAAGIAATLALIVTFLRGALDKSKLFTAAEHTLTTCGSIFYILFGAFVFKTFIAFTGLPFALSEAVTDLQLSQTGLLCLILVSLIVLGTFLDGFAILVLTIPVIQPMLEAQGINLIWFGVLMVITLEMALISPPVGMNVFVVKSLMPRTSLLAIFKGIFPFWIAMAFAILFILMFPSLALYLPGTVY